MQFIGWNAAQLRSLKHEYCRSQLVKQAPASDEIHELLRLQMYFLNLQHKYNHIIAKHTCMHSKPRIRVPVQQRATIHVLISALYKATVFPLIEAGSQIQAGSLTEAGGSKGYHRTNCTHPLALWCIASFVCIVRLTERRYGMAYRVFRFAVINIKPRILVF